ncbi:ABC transporter substrate-binding protein [Paraburkholderia bannensis]|uniref:ABC transporter substrate-binding protein n=1 Tax=Paraburkholderia bannensis TaxID=765414 RepID=UPI002AB5E137|nr:ABC transporter substrate-binding protein [Paraburkholderia bannensis]
MKSSADTLHVGATASLTGPYSIQGRYMQDGYELFCKKLNAQGGVRGRQVKLTTYDDRSDPLGCAALYERLICEDEVDVLLGPYGSSLTEAAADVTEKYGKVMLAATAGVSSIWEKGRRFIFMVLAPSRPQRRACSVLPRTTDFAAWRSFMTTQ